MSDAAADDEKKQPPYISNDSSIGPDEFYDARETLEKRISSMSRGSNATAYGSGRSTTGYGSNRSGSSGAAFAAPTPIAAELIAHLASNGSGRKIDVGAAIECYGNEGEGGGDREIFGSTTATEGPPGGTLGLDNFSTARLSMVGENEAIAGDDDVSLDIQEGTAGSSAHKIRRWPPPPKEQPQRIVTYDISSADTTPNTTPGGHNHGKGNIDGLGGGVWGGGTHNQSPTQPSPRPRVGPGTNNTNPFAATDAPAAGPSKSTNPFAPGTTCSGTVPPTSGLNPFAQNDKKDDASSGACTAGASSTNGDVEVGRSGSTAPAQVSAAASDSKNSNGAKARPPPLPPRRPLSLTRLAKGDNLVPASSPTRSSGTIDSSTTDAASAVFDGTDAGSVGSSAASVDTASAGGRGSGDEDSKYMVVNKDTGQVFDVRELEQHLPTDGYTTGLLPSRADLIALERRRSASISMSAKAGGTSDPSMVKDTQSNSSSSRPSSIPRGAMICTSRRPLSPSGRPSISSVAASMAAAVGTASTRKEKARSLGKRVRKGLGKVATAAGRSSAGGGGSTSSSAGDEVGGSDRVDNVAGGGGGGGAGGRSGGGIGAAARSARSALNGIRVSFKGKETSETLAGLMLFQELKAHDGPIWTAAFNQSGKFLATAGQDMKIVMHRVGDLSKDPYAAAEETGDGKNVGGKNSDSGGAEDGAGNFKSPPTSAPDSDAASMGGNRTDTASVPCGSGEKSGSSSVGRTCGNVPPDCGNEKDNAEKGRQGSSPDDKALPMFVGVEPCQVLEAHRADVVALAWSRNDFLLSASLDKTVRLWHTTQPGCLHFFRHNDIVTAVDFHPLWEHFFLSGCFDKKVRVWNIRDGHVQLWQQAPDMVTAAKFSLDGSMIVAGLYMGQVLFYQTEGMRYFTQIECRNRRGSMKRGRKVTGFAFKSTADSAVVGSGNGEQSSRSPSTSPGNRNSSTEAPRPGDGRSVAGSVGGGGGRGAGARSTGVAGPGGKGYVPEQLLVTTNDSRVRLYNTDDFVMNAKYKGLSNDTLQITASFSEDGKQIISGSENGKVYVWSTGVTTKPPAPESGTMLPDAAAHAQARPGFPVSTTQKDTNRAHESFDASQGDPKIVTFACFVPQSTARACVTAVRQSLGNDISESADYCGSLILATDYEGTIRVYCNSPVMFG